MRFIGIAISLAASLWAGEIRLQVNDPSGMPMRATGIFNGQKFETDSLGRHNFAQVANGRFKLEVLRSGFATQSVEITVDSDTPVQKIVTLEILRDRGSIVRVVAALPLPGLNLSRDEMPAQLQSANSNSIENSGSLNLSDFLNKRFSGVYLNEVQGNPYQPDLNFRGYTASPLLGTPQGISIYLDGVRMNQPFGDVVSWDLLPRITIAETTLIPSSNPLFGLNTLGGAIANETKSGNTAPGTSIQLSGGSFGRRIGEIEHGGVRGHLDWYLASTLFFEDGWRQSSPSNVRQFFAKPGWKTEKTRAALSMSFANNTLTGNGLQEQQFLQQDYTSVYTKPDTTKNLSPMLNLRLVHSLEAGSTFAGNVYYRYIRTRSINGDLNNNSLDQSVYQPSAADRAALAAAGYSGFPASGATAANTPFPKWRCIGQALLRDEPAEKCNGLITRSSSLQHNFGASGQWTKIANRNQFTAGAGWDGNRVLFSQLAQLGYLNADRSVTGVSAFADGVTGGNIDGESFDTRVHLQGSTHTSSIFATNTLSLTRKLHLNTSGRYNRTILDNLDQILPRAGSGSLTGHHVFQRFNPSAGISFSPKAFVNLYASVSQSSRAPTSIELGCADPAQPCKLPNAMAGDPPLKQVVTRSVDAGVRGGEDSAFNWNLGWFRADNRDDILFVSSGAAGFGYFTNFGKTRRQGIDLGASRQIGRVLLGANYTWLDARYRSREVLNGSSNSSNIGGRIPIGVGAKIPLIPGHSGKAYSEIRATKALSVHLDFAAFSSSYARGNENNDHQADAVYYLGSGKSPGYAVMSVGARYRVHSRIEIFAQVSNLLDRQYYSAAQLGATGFTAAGSFLARPFPAVDGNYPLRHATFLAPGAPRQGTGGIRIRF